MGGLPPRRSSRSPPFSVSSPRAAAPTIGDHELRCHAPERASHGRVRERRRHAHRRRPAAGSARPDRRAGALRRLLRQGGPRPRCGGSRRTGSRVTLVRDPALDATDRYGRRLRYVFGDGHQRQRRARSPGAASPYFFRGERGRYAAALLAAVAGARAASRGYWAACPTRGSTRGSARSPAAPDRAVARVSR